MNLNNKVTLITGASRGLGRETTLLFAEKGADVVINYNNSYEDALTLKEKIESLYHVNTMIIKADVSNEEEVKNMVDLIIEKFGKIDILVNNAGIAIDTTFNDKSVENFRRILDVNLIGTFLVSKYVSVNMMKNKYGKIINIASNNGIDSYYPESMDYDASKSGVISLTHNLAVQFAPYINVNAIAPGWINTEMNEELSTEFVEKEKSSILLNRFANTREIANTILFLASDESSYINSSIIKVDGGLYKGTRENN